MKNFCSSRKTRPLLVIINVLIFISFSFLILPNRAIAEDENLRVLDRWMKYTDAENSLYHHLSSLAINHLEQRKSEIAGLDSKDQWLKRQKDVRKKLFDIVGPFPEKTPLKAQILAKVKKEDYTLEKIVYESMPNFYVTACLFVPDGLKGKTPAVLFCSGHSAQAFRRDIYQQTLLNLVKKGFIVLAFDPIGQGERLQYYDANIGESRIGGSTLEHSYPGAQCFIAGYSVARYFIWDGIRGIDYLLSRPEVDPDRIGCHGLSGGGTQSSYIAAFDERVKAVAPAGYITSFRKLFESIGPQDAEQNLFGFVANGLDHADLLEVRVPKPALIVATTRDFFSIQGSRETFKEVQKVYQFFGKEDNIAICEDDYVHGYTTRNREAIYAFFQKHLDLPGDATDEKVDYLTTRELQVTPTGQISTSYNSKTVYDLNKSKSQELLSNQEKSRQNPDRGIEEVKNSAKELSGFVYPDKSSDVVFTGRYQRQGYSVEKYFIQGEGDYIIPFLLMVPDGDVHIGTVIYLHPEGKSAGASPGGEMEWFVKKGYVVLSPDLIGTGEMGPGGYKGDAYNFKVGRASFNIWFAAIQISRSIVGIQAGDLERVVNYLKSRQDVKRDNILAVARGNMCPVLLHTAALDNSINRVALVEPMLSYRSIAMNPYYKPSFVLASIPGSLGIYDLPDLSACLAPRPLLMVNVTDQNGHRAKEKAVDQEMSIVKNAYQKANASAQLQITTLEAHDTMDKLLTDWIK